MKNRPNILFIMVDNMPAELLGCYGNDEIHTPHIDNLAQGGIQFDEAYCPNAMCSPCRASALTGLMPSQHGVHTWLDDRVMHRWPEKWGAIEEFNSLPKTLKVHGYQTALIGKYHIGDPAIAQDGFEHWISFPHGHTLNFYNNTVIENGCTDTYAGHSVDYFTGKAVEYLDTYDAGADTPFFMFLTYNAPYGHWPACKGPSDNRFASLYEQTPMHSVPRRGLNKKTIDLYELQKHLSGGGLDFGALLRIPNDLTTLRNYFSQMSMVDDGVGQVLSALTRNRLDNTLVIYTADHGFSLGHNGFWGHGQACWPSSPHHASFNIPLIVSHTNRITDSRKSEIMVSGVDLFATILDYVGLSSELDGSTSASRSFAPALQDDSADWQNRVFMEQEETRAIRTPQWLYMKRFKGSETFPLEDELYDLQNDPNEESNLLADSASPPILTELDKQLDAFFSDHLDPRFDLWSGGAVKSNSSRTWLWEDAWGDSWKPVY